MPTIYPPLLTYDPKYTLADRELIQIMYGKMRAEARRVLTPYVGEDRIIEVSNNIPTEFIADPNHRMLGGKNLGLATRDRNWNFMPANADPFIQTLYSGVANMEFWHTIFGRLLPGLYEWIDIIHWLYNENRLYNLVFKYKKHWYSWRGTTHRIVVPDVAYGWVHREEIMEGIRTGKYKEGRHEYSSDPAFAGTKPAPTAVPATQHDLEMIRNWLRHGNVHGAHWEHSH